MGGDAIPAPRVEDGAQAEARQARADVLDAVQGAGHCGGGLAAPEVHAGGAAEHAVDAEDEHGREAQQGHRPDLAAPGALAEGEAQEAEHDHLHEVEDEGHGGAAGLEQLVTHPATHEATEDATKHEGHSCPPKQVLLLAQVVDLLQVFGEVEHHALADKARAELGADERHDDGVLEDLPDQVPQRHGRVLGEVRIGAVPGVEVRQACMAGAVAHQEPVHTEHEGHGCGGHEPDDRPAAKAGQQPGPDGGGQEVARADHHAEDAAEDTPLFHMEPGAVDLHHRERPEALEVHVEAPEQAHAHEHPGGVPLEEHEANGQVDQGSAQGAHQDGLAPADAVGNGAIQGHGQAVGPETSGSDEAHGGLVQVVPGADVVLHDIEVVATHVHGRIGQAQGEPVHEPAQTEGRGVFHGDLWVSGLPEACPRQGAGSAGRGRLPWAHWTLLNVSLVLISSQVPARFWKVAWRALVSPSLASGWMARKRGNWAVGF